MMETPNMNEIIWMSMWFVAMMACPVFLILFGQLEAFNGIRKRFFSTRLRATATCESVGIAGSVTNLLIAPSEYLGMLFVTGFFGIIVLLSVLIATTYYDSYAK